MKNWTYGRGKVYLKKINKNIIYKILKKTDWNYENKK